MHNSKYYTIYRVGKLSILICIALVRMRIFDKYILLISNYSLSNDKHSNKKLLFLHTITYMK